MSDPFKVTTSTIPQLDGTNYTQWATAVRSFMRYSGVWHLIEGYGSTGTTPQPGTPRPAATAAEEQAKWDEKNDKALGVIQMYTKHNLQHLIADKYTAFEAWTTLKTQYEKPGAVGAFVAFQNLFNA